MQAITELHQKIDTINARLAEVNPFYQEKAFVNEVLREMNRKNRQLLTTPKTGMAMSAG